MKSVHKCVRAVGELRGRKEFDYTASTYPNEPHHVNIVHPSTQAALEPTQPILHHLSVYCGEKKTPCPIERVCPLRPKRKGNAHHIYNEQKSPLCFCGEKEENRTVSGSHKPVKRTGGADKIATPQCN